MDKQIVFVGNPNVGKSTWINALSNADFKVGNWAGVTVEKKEAIVTWGSETYHLIDLPGTYDIVDSVNEEAITSRYLQNEVIDLIVNVVDATNLSRNLYLTLLLRELQYPMIIIFNFMDEVEKYTIDIDIESIEHILQVPIYPCSAFDTKGYKQVIKAIQTVAQKTVIHKAIIPKDKLEKYELFKAYVNNHLPSYIEQNTGMIENLIFAGFYQDETSFKQLQAWDMEMQYIYEFSELPSQKALDMYAIIQTLTPFIHASSNRLHFTRSVDKVLLHPLLGIPLLLLICSTLMIFIFNGSAPFTEFIDFFLQDMVMKYVYAIFSFLPNGALSLITNGLLAGVGGILVFVPLMSFLYFALSFLEECGYMARIAFLLDTLMHHFHLSGKSFVSLLLGFGCNVPAIYATRTLDNEKQKRLTALLIPFMSCGARLPVYMLFAAAFFKEKAALMVLSIYGIGILLALLLALLFSRSTHFHDQSVLILELPPYRKPAFQVMRKKVGQEVFAYIKKAIGVVMWAMIILWGCSYFPNGNVNDSYIAQFAKQIAPVYEPLGFGTRWESVAALPGSIVAKESVVGFLGQVLNTNDVQVYDEIEVKEDIKRIAFEVGATLKKFAFTFSFQTPSEPQNASLVSNIASLWKDEKANLRAFSYMVYILLSIPCVMSLQALYREYGYKLMCLSIFVMLLVPYITSFLIFQFFSLFI